MSALADEAEDELADVEDELEGGDVEEKREETRARVEGLRSWREVSTG